MIKFDKDLESVCKSVKFRQLVDQYYDAWSRKIDQMQKKYPCEVWHDDVVLQTFVDAFMRYEKANRVGMFHRYLWGSWHWKTWIIKQNYWRKKRRRDKKEKRAALTHELAQHRPHKWRNTMDVDKLLDTLDDPRHQEVLRKHYLEGKSYHTIAAEIGRPAMTLHQHEQKTIKFLQELPQTQIEEMIRDDFDDFDDQDVLGVQS